MAQLREVGAVSEGQQLLVNGQRYSMGGQRGGKGDRECGQW